MCEQRNRITDVMAMVLLAALHYRHYSSIRYMKTPIAGLICGTVAVVCFRHSLNQMNTLQIWQLIACVFVLAIVISLLLKRMGVFVWSVTMHCCADVDIVTFNNWPVWGSLRFFIPPVVCALSVAFFATSAQLYVRHVRSAIVRDKVD